MNLRLAGFAFARFALVAALSLATARGAAAATNIAGGNLGNQTWTPAGSPYVVSGDIIVQPGATLTIQAGTDVQFLATDGLASGVDTARIELTVNGSLNVAGTAANPVKLEVQPGQASGWYGIIVGAGAASASITGASISGTVRAITSSMTGATLTVTRTTIQSVSNSGVFIQDGPATLDGVTVIGTINTTQTGLELTSSSATSTTHISVLNSVVYGCYFGADIGNGSVLVDISSSTFDHGAYGIAVAGSYPSVTVRNSIVTNSNNVGLLSPVTSQLTVSYSDVWNNVTNYSGVSQGTTNLSANPQFVSSTDFHLQASSVCIDSGTATGAPDHDRDGTPRPLDGDGVNGAAYDMGAYEYNPGGATGGTSGTGTGGNGAGGAAGTSGTGGSAGATGSGGGAGNGGAGAGGATTGAGGAATGAGGATTGAGGAATGAGGATTGAGGAATGAGGATTGAGGATATGGSGGAAGTSGAAGTGGATGGGGAGGTTTGGGGASTTTGTGGATGGAGASGGAGATAGASGKAGSSGAAGGPGTGGITADNSGAGGGGCGCETGGTPASAWGLAFVAAALLGRRRRGAG
jgi:hypothetical protein